MEETEDDSTLERLRKAIDEGDRSGNPEPFDLERFIEMKRRPRDFRQ
ncbi:type II toxin-antitoxin system ParD family antitoxin [Mesorhizobium sp. VK4C]|nr:type II toxin-antitoxin system ParD family antitoxin [Mesorhizobium sp. VK4C]MDX8500219.1 type II toxin-antitoxin system ParD family antitoxin [Mesorhizobium sp. VK4C]